jgi:hypothetical protein
VEKTLENLLVASAFPSAGGVLWEEWYSTTRLALADWLEERGEDFADDLRRLEPAPVGMTLPIPVGGSLISLRLWLGVGEEPQTVTLARVDRRSLEVHIVRQDLVRHCHYNGDGDLDATWEPGQLVADEASVLIVTVPSLCGGWFVGRATWQHEGTEDGCPVFLAPVELSRFACRALALMYFSEERFSSLPKVDGASLIPRLRRGWVPSQLLPWADLPPGSVVMPDDAPPQT